MKVIDFPKDEGPSETDEVVDFLEKLKETAVETGATDAVVILMNADGEIGAALCASYFDAHGMLSLTIKEL